MCLVDGFKDRMPMWCVMLLCVALCCVVLWHYCVVLGGVWELLCSVVECYVVYCCVVLISVVWCIVVWCSVV